MDYLRRGLRRTFWSLLSRITKILFGIVFLLQLLFLVSLLSVAIYYPGQGSCWKTPGDHRTVGEDQYNAEMIRKELLSPRGDYPGVFNSYNSMVQNLQEFVILFSLLFSL